MNSIMSATVMFLYVGVFTLMIILVLCLILIHQSDRQRTKYHNCLTCVYIMFASEGLQFLSKHEILVHNGDAMKIIQLMLYSLFLIFMVGATKELYRASNKYRTYRQTLCKIKDENHTA